MFSLTKSYRGFAVARRLSTSNGKCGLIHGHNFGFDLLFTCQDLDPGGLVVDPGELGMVKEFFRQHFDHTLLLEAGDPFIKVLRNASIPRENTWAKVVELPSCGMEGLALFVFTHINKLIWDGRFGNAKRRGVKVSEVTCHEDDRTWATYRE